MSTTMVVDLPLPSNRCPDLAGRRLEHAPSEFGADAIRLPRLGGVFDTDKKVSVEPAHKDMDLSSAVSESS
jgi:hypothetical protein